jgi:hypothetical protein
LNGDAQVGQGQGQKGVHVDIMNGNQQIDAEAIGRDYE